MMTHLARGILLLLAGCERPGEGAKAAAGYAACEPVIEALAQSNAENPFHPDTLADLAPTYLSKVPGTWGTTRSRHPTIRFPNE